MNEIIIKLNEPELYDVTLRGKDGTRVLQDAGDLRIITKDGGMHSGRAVAMLTFHVDVDGKCMRAQTVVPVRLLLTAAAALFGRYDPDGFPLQPHPPKGEAN
jgi:hypothetical protein